MGLEPYEGRYTLQLQDWTERAYKKRGVEYVVVPGTTIDDSKAIVTGQVLRILLIERRHEWRRYSAHELRVNLLGNSPKIALKHYLQTTEDHFDKAISGTPKATQNATQQTSEMARRGSQREIGKCKNPEKNDLSRGSMQIKMAGAGFEPTTSRLWASRATRLLHPASLAEDAICMIWWACSNFCKGTNYIGHSLSWKGTDMLISDKVHRFSRIYPKISAEADRLRKSETLTIVRPSRSDSVWHEP